MTHIRQPEKRTIHLICGPSGAGKTTVALRIAKERQAMPLFIDECLKQRISFPLTPDFGFLATVVGPVVIECGNRIIQRCEEVLATEKEVVLDIGVFQRDWRDKIRQWAAGQKFSVTLYHVTASKETRRKRVLERNTQEGEKPLSLFVPEWVFDLSESLFEPPSSDEDAVQIDNEGEMGLK